MYVYVDRLLALAVSIKLVDFSFTSFMCLIDLYFNVYRLLICNISSNPFFSYTPTKKSLGASLSCFQHVITTFFVKNNKEHFNADRYYFLYERAAGVFFSTVLDLEVIRALHMCPSLQRK